MRITAKVVIAGIIAALSVASLVHLTRRAQPSLGQVPMTGKEIMEKMVTRYVNENMPVEIESMSDILAMHNTKFSGSVSEIEKVSAKEYFELLSSVLPVKLTAEDIEELTKKVQASQPTNFIKTFSTESIDQIKEDGFAVAHQAIFIVFPAEDTSVFTISAKYSKRSGKFAPIVKEVVERICKKKFFGVFETCEDVVKRIETPRIVTDKMKQQAQVYLTALMLNDLKENRTSSSILLPEKTETKKTEVKPEAKTPKQVEKRKRQNKLF